jgi:hypothetical protein
MREISMELGNWEAVRQEVLIFPETAKNISMLVEVALDEGDIERALQLLKVSNANAVKSIVLYKTIKLVPEFTCVV